LYSSSKNIDRHFLLVGRAEVGELGGSEGQILTTQGNLAATYQFLGRKEEALRMRREAYFGFLRIQGEEHVETLREANNYAWNLLQLRRLEEVKSLMRKTIPVARRVLGESDKFTFTMRWHYARALYFDTGATLDGLREAVTTLEEIERIVRRVFGGAHPLTVDIGGTLREARAALRARETPPSDAS
jgi:hypothetical protein